MTHIFRIYKGGVQGFRGWSGSPAFPYNSTNRDTIEDPDGASALHEITSIPSPFARIDLIKNAFREVCKKRDLDGQTIFHKMVSDSLDVGEIFFNIEKFRDKIEIIPWDVTSAIEELITSDNNGHQILGDALSKYLRADTSTYNFGQLKNLYLLNYKNGPDALNIIGATSPATLFFSNANDLSYVSKDLVFGTDKPFDSAYQPLYKRDYDYVKAWFAFCANCPQFAARFPEIDEYLDLTLKSVIDSTHKNELANIKPIAASGYDEISVNYEQQAHVVEVLGISLLSKRTNLNNIESNFQIKASRNVDGKLLVLPVDSGSKYADFQYITDSWGKENTAPFFDNRDFDLRTLPNEGTKIPYLTISDFLEDYLVQVPHTLNKAEFFDGNITIRQPKLSYLLPLKPLFFRYFSADDLITNDSDGELPTIEMRQLSAGGVSVTLSIPIKGKGRVKQIEYNRVYYANNDADIQSNKGGIRICDFDGLVMPLVRFKDSTDAIYKVACIYAPKSPVTVGIYQNDELISNVESSTRYYDSPDFYRTAKIYTIKETNFEFIQISRSENKGILLPKFRTQQEFNKIEFSVDLGTSNTHIEYRKVGDNDSEPFSFSKANSLLSVMFVPSLLKDGSRDDLDYESNLIERDLLPLEVNASKDFHFPTRTVLSRGKQANRNVTVPFGQVNIPLTKDRRRDVNYNDYIFDIKWGKNKEEQQSMEVFVDILMLMLRNKVITENGDLHQTKLTWFYPSSMPNKRFTKLRDAWNNAFKKYFNAGDSLYTTESFAPIQYYFKRYSTTTNLINIDIGGGTTDVAYAVNRDVLFTTSFRFAANNLFENPYAEDSTNGIVDFYKDEIWKLIKDVSELGSLFEKYKTEPANMASFLFSLKGSTLLKRIDVNSIDFNYRLAQDDNFRIVFLIFYTAIIYHVAQIVRLKKLDIPRHITFGGNGSKSLNIITTDANLLSSYTKLIFEEVVGQKTKIKLEILGLGNASFSKESTCKGGLLGVQKINNEIKNVVMKANGISFMEGSDTYSIINTDYKSQVVEAVKRFFNFFFEMNTKFDFDSNFGVNKEILKLAKNTCFSDDLSTFLTKGLDLNKSEIDNSDKIKETAFFYPIKGILQELSNNIYEFLK